MSTARIPDGTPQGLVQVGLAEHRYIVPSGRSHHPVKPRYHNTRRKSREPVSRESWGTAHA